MKKLICCIIASLLIVITSGCMQTSKELKSAKNSSTNSTQKSVTTSSPKPSVNINPKIRVIASYSDGYGHTKGFGIFENDKLIWESEQGSPIACVGNNLYYKVSEQLRYVNLTTKEPKIVSKDFFSVESGFGSRIEGTNFVLFNNFWIMDASMGVTLDKMCIPAITKVNQPVYHNGWLYFEWAQTLDAKQGWIANNENERSLYRINIDAFKLGNKGTEISWDKKINKTGETKDAQLLYSYFGSGDGKNSVYLGDGRGYALKGNYIYYSKPSSFQTGKFSKDADTLCIRKNLETKKEETIYEFPAIDGLKELQGITRTVKIGNYVVYYALYKDGSISSYKTCVYDMEKEKAYPSDLKSGDQVPVGTTVQSNDCIFNSFKNSYGGYLVAFKISDNKVVSIKLESKSYKTYRILTSGDKVFVTYEGELYYVNNDTMELMKYEKKYNYIFQVDII